MRSNGAVAGLARADRAGRGVLTACMRGMVPAMRRSLVLLVALTVVVAACSDDASSTTTTTEVGGVATTAGPAATTAGPAATTAGPVTTTAGPVAQTSPAVESQPRVRIILEVPAGTNSLAMDEAAEVLARRFEASIPGGAAAAQAAGQRIQVLVAAPGIEDVPDSVFAELLTQGVLSFRPVLALAPGSDVSALGGREFEGLTLGDAGVSPADDRAFQVVYLAASADFVYHLGPAFITSTDIVAARAEELGGSSLTWAVVPTFTVDGQARFREMTGILALEPPGDPERSLAISLDGAVISARAVAEDVGPEGITPENVAIIGFDEDGAHRLATIVMSGSIPFEITLVSISHLAG